MALQCHSHFISYYYRFTPHLCSFFNSFVATPSFYKHFSRPLLIFLKFSQFRGSRTFCWSSQLLPSQFWLFGHDKCWIPCEATSLLSWRWCFCVGKAPKPLKQLFFSTQITKLIEWIVVEQLLAILELFNGRCSPTGSPLNEKTLKLSFRFHLKYNALEIYGQNKFKRILTRWTPQNKQIRDWFTWVIAIERVQVWRNWTQLGQISIEVSRVFGVLLFINSIIWSNVAKCKASLNRLSRFGPTQFRVIWSLGEAPCPHDAIDGLTMLWISMRAPTTLSNFLAEPNCISSTLVL